MSDQKENGETYIHSPRMSRLEDEDKKIEQERYDRRAKERVLAGNPLVAGSYDNIPAAIRAPYLYYSDSIRELATSGLRVLEIGAGTGEHTGYLLEKGAQVTATDISVESLSLLYQQHSSPDVSLDTCVADMEDLPFPSETFNLITAAGCLSYGDNNEVLLEIHRTLRPGGFFVCVDSLNDNPIYRLNRLLHYLRGGRSRSTLLRMPTTRMLANYASKFETISVRYFGAITFALPILRRLLREEQCARLVDRIDGALDVKKSAFKFVMVAQKSMKPLPEGLKD